MAFQHVKVSIKDGGSSGKKKKEDENKATSSSSSLKAKQNLPPLKTQTQSGTTSSTPTATTPHAYDTPTLSPTVTAQTADGVSGSSRAPLARGDGPLAAGGVANRDSAQNGSSSEYSAEYRQPNYGTTTTPTTSVRQYTYDDYLDTLSKRIALEALQQWGRETYTPAIHKVSTASTPVVKPDYSSPNAAWRNPETFEAMPWEEYDKLDKNDRSAYLKAYAKNSMTEKQKRDEEAQAQAKKEKEEESEKRVREYLYESMIKGSTMDVSGFKPETISYMEQRAYEDLCSGKISQTQYALLPIHSYRGIDNRREKLYNGDIYSTTQPHLAASGFDRYRTDLSESLLPDSAEDSKKESSYGEYKDVLLKALNNTLRSIDEHYSKNEDYYNRADDLRTSCQMMIDAVNADIYPDELPNGMKVQIWIDPNYNTSGNQLLQDVANIFFQPLGSLMSLVEYDSQENKDINNILDIGTTVIEQRSDEETKKAFNVLGWLEALNTVANWNSDDNKATDIHVFFGDGGASYQYHAVVDKDMMFTEMNSGFTGQVIKPEDDMFKIILE